MRVLITGCGSGLGKELYWAFIRRGHAVYPHYRIGVSGGHSIVGDITEPGFTTSLRSYVIDNRIDVFINNAAVYASAPAEAMREYDVLNVVNTNLTAQILMINSVYGVFKERGSGKIININSLAGLAPTAGETVYAATKHGLSGYSKSLQLEAIGTGVRILDVYPGAMKTNMAKHRKDYESLLDPIDVANHVVKITEDDSMIVTESIIRRPS